MIIKLLTVHQYLPNTLFEKVCGESGVVSKAAGLLMTGIKSCAVKHSHVMFKININLGTGLVPRDLNFFCEFNIQTN